MSNCKLNTCKKVPIFSSEYCWNHLEDKRAYKERLVKLFSENASLKGANLSGVDLSSLELARKDLSQANLSRANLSDANLFDANLADAELLGADLTKGDLTSANLRGADLTRADLRRARLWHANLENANLIEANLDYCDMWNVKLSNVRLWRTEISHAISLSKKNFEAKKGRFLTTYRINEKGILSAEEAYRTLKKYFIANGKYTDASWASFKEKTMEKLLLKKNKNLAYLPNLIMGALCGYGEKPHRIILSSLFMILFYAAAYWMLKAVIFSQYALYKMTPSDYVYYSAVTFTTLGYGDFIPKSSALFRGLAASEAFIGAFMIGLFIFTLARKYSAR